MTRWERFHTHQIPSSIYLCLFILIVLSRASPYVPDHIVSRTPESPETTLPYTLRRVHANDFESVTTTFVRAFDPGVVWTYIYQFRYLYPAHHYRCMGEHVKSIYDTQTKDDWFMGIHPNPDHNATELISDYEEDRFEERPQEEIVSFSTWSLKKRGDADLSEYRNHSLCFVLGLCTHSSSVDGHHHPPIPAALKDVAKQNSHQVSLSNDESDNAARTTSLLCSANLDTNLIRLAHLLPQLIAAEDQYITDAYEFQLYLGTLATHPDWDGHGFGAAHVRWGIRKAESEAQRLSKQLGRRVRIPVTLLATPAGHTLYKELGFEEAANITFKLLNGFNGGETWYEYMRYWSD